MEANVTADPGAIPAPPRADRIPEEAGATPLTTAGALGNGKDEQRTILHLISPDPFPVQMEVD